MQDWGLGRGGLVSQFECCLAMKLFVGEVLLQTKDGEGQSEKPKLRKEQIRRKRN